MSENNNVKKIIPRIDEIDETEKIQNSVYPKYQIPTGVGLGTYYTCSAIMALLLGAEDNPAQVIASLIKEMGITPEQVSDHYYDSGCPECGMSMLMHRDSDMNCSNSKVLND